MSLFMNLTGETYEFTALGQGVLIALVILAVFTTCFFTDKDKKNRISVKQLVFSAMCVALAMVTSSIKLWRMPTGGSITLFSMFFITFVGYLYGLRAGLTAAVAYGMLQLIFNPYVVSIPQLIIEYPLAFGALGLSGIFSNSKYGMCKGYLTGIVGRMFFAVLSGVIFFGQYAPENMNAFTYSFVYNGVYIITEGVLTAVILCVPAVRYVFKKVRYLANEDDVRARLSQTA